MMSKPKYIVILKVLFCSVVAGVLRTFTRFFRKCFGKGWLFGMTTMAFGLGKPSPGQKWKLTEIMQTVLASCVIPINKQLRKLYTEWND